MPDWIPRLRDALVAADFTFDAVSRLLGTTAHAALGRNETTPGLRRTSDGSPLATLTRLWLLQATAPLAEVERALPGLVDELCVAGVLERSVGEVAARVDLRPYGTDDGNLWVLADLTPGLDGGPNRVGPDHVLGISPAATSLAQLTVRDAVGSALDLGTGCGVQSLHLAAHAGRVVATDVNRRALWIAGLNAELNADAVGDCEIALREGSFFEPVADERFDLVVTNPPFVISPATGERLVYRDSGLPGDRAVEHIVRISAAPPRAGRSRPGAGQLGDRARPVLGRAAERLAAGLRLRRLGRPARGARPGRVRRALAQGRRPARCRGLPRPLRHLVVLARRAGCPGCRFRVDQPEGERRAGAPPRGVALGGRATARAEVAAHFARMSTLRGLTDDELAASRPRLRDDVVQETRGPAGAEDPSTIVLRQQRGMRRARQVDTVEAALAGACDGDLPSPSCSPRSHSCSASTPRPGPASPAYERSSRRGSSRSAETVVRGRAARRNEPSRYLVHRQHPRKRPV